MVKVVPMVTDARVSIEVPVSKIVLAQIGAADFWCSSVVKLSQRPLLEKGKMFETHKRFSLVS